MTPAAAVYDFMAGFGIPAYAATSVPASSEGAADDPAYTAGDLLKGDAEAFMPLYRVKLSGINAADPEPMFSVLTPLATLGDSVSSETGYRFLYGNSLSTEHVAYHKKGFLVEMFWNFLQETTQVFYAGTLPVEFRPAYSFLMPAVRTLPNGIVSNNTAEVEVRASGEVVFIAANAIAEGRNVGHCIWIAA